MLLQGPTGRDDEIGVPVRQHPACRHPPIARLHLSGPPIMPTMFDRILGHHQAIQTLRAALRSDRIHHAWVFHGPVGVGKYTTALAFAAYLLDPDAQPNLAGEIEIDPDGKAARLVRSGQHPDLHLVSKEMAVFSDDYETRGRKQKNIPIEVVRQFVIQPAVRTGHGKSADATTARATKVFIIDEAELLDSAAQDTLLKTLEEPAPGTVLILVTCRQGDLKPTIRSRCQRIAFHPLTDDEMDRWLERSDHATVTGVQWADLKHVGRGSPGLVQTLISADLLEWLDTVRGMLMQLEAGRLPVEAAPALAAHIEAYARDRVKENKQASKDAANRQGASLMFTLLAEEFRSRLSAALNARDVRRGMQVVRWIEYLELAQQQLNSNVNIKLVLDNLVIQCAGAASDDPVEPICPGWFDTAGRI